jgi:hypothetical protein
MLARHGDRTAGNPRMCNLYSITTNQELLGVVVLPGVQAVEVGPARAVRFVVSLNCHLFRSKASHDVPQTEAGPPIRIQRCHRLSRGRAPGPP